MSNSGRRSESERRAPYYPPRTDPLRAPWNPTDPAPGRRRSIPGGRDHIRKQSALGRFVSTWGWRAYAIPVLLVLTAVVLFDALGKSRSDPTNTDHQEPAAQVIGEAPPRGKGTVPASGQLPDGGPFLNAGERTFRVVAGSGSRVGRASAQQFTYTVEVENGIDTADFGGDEAVARMVDATLNNPKSWTADGKVALQRIDSGTPSFRVSLTSPMTVRDGCGYDIQLESSCFSPQDERVYLNLARWVRGASSFQGDIGSYRQYLINHEVGHAVGHPDHEPCPANGVLAPIMMQQTFGVKNSDLFKLDPHGVFPNNDDTCRYNPWPFPEGPGGR